MWRDPGTLDALLGEVDAAAGADRRLDAFVAALRRDAGSADELEPRARRIAERLALALQGSLLVRHAPAEVGDAVCAGRLAGDAGLGYGTLPPGADLEAIVVRHTPPA